jgi:hypothetical protein
MNEVRQARALFDAFLARFFENEISEGSSDLTRSFIWILAMLGTPGILIPMTSMMRWRLIELQSGHEVLRAVSLGDKAAYLALTMGGLMLLTAVVWQALLADRRDAIVLGSFPVRPRVIVASKLLALLAYLAIVAGGTNAVPSVLYALPLASSIETLVRGVPAHFIASAGAGMFACIAVAAIQATLVAAGGPRLFSRVTAPAQLGLAATGFLLILMSPAVGGAARALVNGDPGAAWAAWLPPVWFLGVYEVVLGNEADVMRPMALRAGAATGLAAALLILAYPLAYRRVAAAAMRGSPIGTRRSMGGRVLGSVVRLLPVRQDVRGAIHFTCLTLGRVARNKLIVAAALGAGTAVALPFVLRWAGATGLAPVPGRSHIAVPFLFAMLGLAGTRMAYNVPSELGAAWIFSTAVRPARIGTSSARVTGMLMAASVTATICLPIYAWYWSAAIATSQALTIFAFACVISEMGLRSVDFVPFTRAYNPDRSNLQARWPLFLMVTLLCLQFLPWAVRDLLRIGNYWLMPALLAAIAVALRLAHPPEPPDLIDADHENKPLALRLY